MTEADKERQRWLPNIWIILFLGLGLRLGWVLMVGVEPFSDPLIYDTYARNLVFHGVYGLEPDTPGAYWAVGASAIYAGAYLTFGVGDHAVVIANMISSTLILIGVYDLGRRWFSETHGRLAALLVAIWPAMVQFNATLASELHFIALSLLALMAWDRSLSAAGWSKRLGFLVLSGLLFGGATYVRPIALLMPAALGIAALLRAPRLALVPVVSSVIATAIIFASVEPWSARNERVFGERVFMSTNFWPNFWIGNNPASDGQYMPLPKVVGGMTEIERSHYMKELALSDLKLSPEHFVLRLPLKAWRMHSRESIGAAWSAPGLRRIGGERLVEAAKISSSSWWFLMLGTGLVGIIVLMRRIGPWAGLLSPPVWLWLYITAVHSVILVGDRFHLPAIPFIAMLVALAVAPQRDRPIGLEH